MRNFIFIILLACAPAMASERIDEMGILIKRLESAQEECKTSDVRSDTVLGIAQYVWFETREAAKEVSAGYDALLEKYDGLVRRVARFERRLTADERKIRNIEKRLSQLEKQHESN